MYRTQLEVVNACLATMGETPLNALAQEHVYKQSALNYLEGSLLARLKEGLWFNSEFITLKPDAGSGFIYVPTDTLHVARPLGQQAFANRGKRLYDTSRNVYEWTGPLTVALVRRLDFEDCPFMAQDAISLSAVLRFQREFDGDGTRYNQIDKDRSRADIELNSENIRQIAPNLLDTLSAAAKMGAIRPDNWNTTRSPLGHPGFNR